MCSQTHTAESLPQVHGAQPTKMEKNTPRLPDVITLDFVTAMMDHFKHDKLLVLDDVKKILLAAKATFAE